MNLFSKVVSCINCWASIENNHLCYYSASNFIKTLVQSDISNAKTAIILIEQQCSLGKRIIGLAGFIKVMKTFLDPDCRPIEERKISVAPVKLCDYGRSRMEMMETVKGFLRCFTLLVLVDQKVKHSRKMLA